MVRLLKNTAGSAGRALITLAICVCALILAHSLWDYYMAAPWTRDGHVRADVVHVTPDVSGLVSDVLVKDEAVVRKGDILFRIDPRRFQLAVAQAKAALDEADAAVTVAQLTLGRKKKLAGQDFASQQTLDENEANLKSAVAAQADARAALDLAKLNLERTAVRATVPGRITNLSLRPGDYASAGTPVAALVDSATVYIAGYFEETKLPRIHVGDPAKVTLMGTTRSLTGHVTSISAGVTDRERSDVRGDLANVASTFSWVRLAQRVPVRITLDGDQAKGLVVGRTATVSID
ncbi:efflux RND transporter periplasmic adaptor subunit [Acidimangrovimonas sediminis]|uniref:efflux RND transporter periplasmic adaptor subunit n=1 Tax=Acidimangrovimonas sediminis TaxID=2056283 RepID=UPI000C7FE8D0|nr:HlyD family secretion protein [Acidimangrovimonas sediminis]